MKKVTMLIATLVLLSSVNTFAWWPCSGGIQKITVTRANFYSWPASSKVYIKQQGNDFWFKITDDTDKALLAFLLTCYNSEKSVTLSIGDSNEIIGAEIQ
jgi:hypothetical protein